MQSFSTVRRVLTALAVTLVAGTMFSQSAQAAAPTKIRDKTFSIGCQVEDGGTRTQFAVGRSELAGTDAHFQVHTDGFFQLGGEGVSDWTDSTVRASVEISDADGKRAGTAYLSATYRVSSVGDRELNRFKDGNIRVVEDHTVSQFAVTDVVLMVNDKQVPGVTCEGNAVDGYLFFTAPSSYVVRGNFLVAENCATENMSDLFFQGSIDAMAVNFDYADSADASAFSQELDLSGGSWTGEFTYTNGDGPVGQVDASVSAVPNGSIIHDWVEKSGVFAARWAMTPYLLTVTADGPVSGRRALARCTTSTRRFTSRRASWPADPARQQSAAPASLAPGVDLSRSTARGGGRPAVRTRTPGRRTRAPPRATR